MPKDHKLMLVSSVLIILIIAITSIQGYFIYNLQNELDNTKIDLKTNQILLETTKKEIEGLIKTLEKRFEVTEEQIEESSSQILNLKKDISNIQVQSLDFTGIIKEALPATVSILTSESQGSGVIISKDGYIVTNYHVIQGVRNIRVFTFDRELYSAKVIGISRVADIALLKIEANNLDYLEFGDSDKLSVGQKVIAFGNPAGLDFTVTEGIISAVNRVGSNGLDIYIQTDVPINPGNSGGPLVDINKEIIGINNFKVGGDFESLGFAIESNYVKEIVDSIFEELEKQQV